MKSQIVLFIGFLLTVNLYSQSVPIIEELDFLPGKINTYYPDDYREKAEYLKMLIEDAVYYYEDVLQDTFSFELYVLDRKNWRESTEAPYPIPHYKNDEKKMFIPVISFYKVYLSDEDTIYGKDHYYLSDFLAIHELGHYITHKQDAKSHSKWSGEFFADYTLITYLHEIIPEYRFDDKPADLFTFLPLKYKRLKNFGKAGILNELAYHPKFMELADQIYIKLGLSFMLKWLELYRQVNKDIKNGKYEHITLTSEEVFQFSIKDIESIEPYIFSEWNKSMRQTYHPWLILSALVMLFAAIRFSDKSITLFKRLGLHTNRMESLFGIPAIRIWYNLRHIRSKQVKYKLVWISVLRILNFILLTILILFLAILLN